MGKISEAVLTDGRKIQYVIEDNPPRGGMKYTYFSPDKSYVVQFFNNPEVGNDENVRRRLEYIIGKYNPTLAEQEGGAIGNSEPIAHYFLNKYCWPTAIVAEPEFGIVCPAYPSNYFFNEYSSTLLELEGKDKKSSWFITRNRRFLEPNELGNFKSMMNMSISLARAVRRMHQAGLAHSDLSCNNVLIDPNTGNCVIIDIDTLVVPGVFPPEVAGTRGYIAPEVLATSDLPYGDSEKKLPSTYTDLHALPVLIYQYLLLRHPLIGPKIYSTESAEEDDFLCMGPQATFIEDPYDNSNRRDDMNVTIHELGPVLEDLFIKAFVNGLHSPNERPTAMEWEKGLIKTWNLLHPCDNPDCTAKWFVLYDVSKPICPFCGHEADKENILRFHIRSGLRGRSGQWADTGVIDVYDNMPLFRWHLFSNVFPDEKADGSLQAYVYKYQGDWIFVNKKVQGMTSPKGDIVPIGKAMILKDGDIFRTSPKENGVLIEVSEGK